MHKSYPLQFAAVFGCTFKSRIRGLTLMMEEGLGEEKGR